MNIAMCAAPSNQIVGMGHCVNRVYDERTGETLCFIGFTDGEAGVFFPRLLPLKVMKKVAKFLDDCVMEESDYVTRIVA